MGERSLVRDGEIELVLASRKAFQRTMSTQLVAAVEAHSGRSVFAFLSDNHIDPDVAVESLCFIPGPTPARTLTARAITTAPIPRRRNCLSLSL